MKKDIYIIRNKINDLVYIGQAVNSATRWSGHKSAARHKDRPIVIDKAMRDLGIENFWYEVIETTENYDERERYWINYYNSQEPNGYNKLNGGDGAQPGINSANAIIRSEEEISNIIDELINSDRKLKDIAAAHNVSLKIISSINRGTAYSDNTLTYPLRKRAADSIDFNLTDLIDDLINTNISIRKLADKYNTTTYIIQEINKGNKYSSDDYTYPLRVKVIDPMPENVRNLLKTTKLSMHEIARQCNTSYTTVAHINSGKYHRVSTESYPIRTAL